MMAALLILAGLAIWYVAVKVRAARDRSERQFLRKFYEIDRSSRGWE